MDEISLKKREVFSGPLIMIKDIEELLFLDPKTYNVVKRMRFEHHYGARAAFYLESKGLAYVSIKKKNFEVYDLKEFKRLRVTPTSNDVVRKFFLI